MPGDVGDFSVNIGLGINFLAFVSQFVTLRDTLTYTQQQNNTKPNFTQKQFTQVPILRNQGTRYFLSLFLAVQSFSPDNIAGFLDIYLLWDFH